MFASLGIFGHCIFLDCENPYLLGEERGCPLFNKEIQKDDNFDVDGVSDERGGKLRVRTPIP